MVQLVLNTRFNNSMLVFYVLNEWWTPVDLENASPLSELKQVEEVIKKDLFT